MEDRPVPHAALAAVGVLLLVLIAGLFGMGLLGAVYLILWALMIGLFLGAVYWVVRLAVRHETRRVAAAGDTLRDE